MFARVKNNQVVEIINRESVDGLLFVGQVVPCDESASVGMVWDGESFGPAPVPERMADDIKEELAALDQWLPRAVEDIIEAEETLGMVSTEDILTTYDKLSVQNQQRLATKRALRAELAALESQE